ncbi:SDR family oxidoreductase [Sphaerisporangium sp. NPDC049002]|uniref:SDR family oxidoreductase n=1 Tax=unclassified Sphaerisporangium TaxID=2630420 RepID=UPI0033DF8CBF
MIVVTGATGQLGRLVVEGLLKTTPPGQIVAAVRNPEKAADLAERGVQVREADYDRPETLKSAFAAGDRVLLISSDTVGVRLPQHKAVVDAAAEAGVALLAYTSVLRGDTSTLALAAEHKGTEEYIRASGIPFSFLRNGWYFENYDSTITQAAEQGTIAGASGEGRVSTATRAEYAAAAVAVLTGEGHESGKSHENTVYELAGDVAWTKAELAAEIAAVTGKPVTYQDLPREEYERVLIGAGLPEPVAAMFAAIEIDIAQGALADTTGDLARLIGRPTTPLRDTVAEVLART